MRHKWSPIGWCVRCNLHRLVRSGKYGIFTRYYGWCDGEVYGSSEAGPCDGWQGHPRIVRSVDAALVEG